ncbi:mitochondrial carrier domain-containing protein [Ochromonadaceae sp. CCMP2298]|nr:mitochondrial carrier domain-containing protein [Ochromonadaceae sp. CCMP2298]
MRIPTAPLLLLSCFLVHRSLPVVDCAQMRGIDDESSKVVAPVPKEGENFKKIFARAKHAAFQGGIFAASAGLVQVLTLMWLRTTVNYQYRYGVPLLEAIPKLYAEGGIPRFYKGIAYAIILGPLSKFGATAANEGSKVIVESFARPATAQLYASLLGTALTVLWRIFLMPLETCKTVLQVDGTQGFDKLMKRAAGRPLVLFQGSAASVLVTATSHYPWFYVYNMLDALLAKKTRVVDVILRSALIGFLASAASDTVSNCVRIVKTVKQATAAEAAGRSYADIVASVYKEGGVVGLLTRGLGGRIIANGIQSVLFTVLWKTIPIFSARWRERAAKRREP